MIYELLVFLFATLGIPLLMLLIVLLQLHIRE